MSKSITITKAAKVKLMPEFNTARKHIANITEHGRRMQHESILLGIELNRVKKQLGIHRGGDQKSKPHGAGLIRWEDIVFEQTGYSVDTCQRWMKIAQGAQKSIPLLTAPDVLKKPFSTLPAKRQEEVVKTLQKAVDGQTMAEMAVTFGVCRAPKLNHPPKPTKASAKKRADNADDEALAAAQLIELAKEDTNKLQDMHTGEAWKALDTDDLADLENKLTAYATAVAAELKLRAGK